MTPTEQFILDALGEMAKLAIATAPVLLFVLRLVSKRLKAADRKLDDVQENAAQAARRAGRLEHAIEDMARRNGTPNPFEDYASTSSETNPRIQLPQAKKP